MTKGTSIAIALALAAILFIGFIIIRQPSVRLIAIGDAPLWYSIDGKSRTWPKTELVAIANVGTGRHSVKVGWQNGLQAYKEIEFTDQSLSKLYFGQWWCVSIVNNDGSASMFIENQATCSRMVHADSFVHDLLFVRARIAG